ncbi:hypothetical protein AB4Y45_33175 [Paraburkholderia sp. EG287A]|uniref:hypothetical protein n=1 Tax=Paraburkholderia sp. EG287A TaxID=3237012 RepID=UPI0034D347FE
MSEVSNLLIVGEAGTGIRAHLRGKAVNALAGREPVLMLDCGRNHEHFCKLMGGSVVTLLTTPGGEETPILSTFNAQNTTPLQVFEFERASRPWTGLLPAPEVSFQRAPGLLVVDDVAEIRSRYPALEQLVREHLAAGGRCCLAGRTESALQPFVGICAPAKLVRFPSES